MRRMYKIFPSLLSIVCCLFGYCVGADQWFGSNQQFLCRCTDNNCLPDGTCADGASCLSEWFGPSCQYQNLVTVYTAKVQPENSLISVTDDSQCNINSGNTYTEVTWNISYPFTFLWLRYKTNVNRDTLNLTLLVNNVSVEQMKVLRISNTIIEIRSPTISSINRLKIEADTFQEICSLYVSGGRNIALKQSASQDSYYNETSYKPTDAVDGNRETDWYLGTCVHSDHTYQYHYWMVQFDKEYLINRYVLFSRFDKPPNPPCCIDRLQNFTLASRNVSGQTVLTYTESVAVPQLTYTVLSDEKKVSKVIVETVNTILNFCEFEAYGDSLCPPDKFGLECNKDCRCRNDEPCFTDTGTCSSGCAAGYTGMGCQTPCTRGTWGVDCSNTCSINCLDMTSCDSTTGACVGGCVAGFKTPTCNQACNFGTLGINCSMSCSPNCGGDKSCDPVNGICNSGCGDGYTGVQCDQECTTGTWGKNCQNNCSSHCVEISHCDFISGECARGCVSGYLPPTCQQEVDSIKNVESRGIGIGIGIGVLITSTVFLIVLLVLYRFKILTLNRKLRNEKERTLTKPETKYQTEHNHAYDEVTDIEASGIQQAQGNANVNESIHAYDAINLDDVGKQNSNYCTIET